MRKGLVQCLVFLMFLSSCLKEGDDLSFYYGLSDTFSDAERELSVAHFYGLGDVQHEVLGKRYFHQVRLSVSIALPLRKRLEDACRIIDK